MNPIIQRIYVALLKDHEQVLNLKDHGENTYSFYVTYQKNPGVVRPYLLKPGIILADPKSILDAVDKIDGSRVLISQF